MATSMVTAIATVMITAIVLAIYIAMATVTEMTYNFLSSFGLSSKFSTFYDFKRKLTMLTAMTTVMVMTITTAMAMTITTAMVMTITTAMVMAMTKVLAMAMTTVMVTAMATAMGRGYIRYHTRLHGNASYYNHFFGHIWSMTMAMATAMATSTEIISLLPVFRRCLPTHHKYPHFHIPLFCRFQYFPQKNSPRKIPISPRLQNIFKKLITFQ